MFRGARYLIPLALLVAFAATVGPVMARCVAFSSLSAPRCMKARRQVAWSIDEDGYTVPCGVPDDPFLLGSAARIFGWLRLVLYGLPDRVVASLTEVRREAVRWCSVVSLELDLPPSVRLRC